jgi:hypothetical protein
VGAELKRSFEGSPKCGCKVSAFMRTVLTPKGILEIPIEVDDRGKKVPVFIYPSSDEKAGSLFAGTSKILRSRGRSSPVYYAPGQLPSAPAGDPLRPFGIDLLKPYEKEDNKGKYIMMWSDFEKGGITDSECFKNIDRSYKALSGIESYVFGVMCNELKLMDKEVGRVRLPDDGGTISVTGPEEEKIMISVSEEKGISFHFNPKITSSEYRDAFWSVFADYAEGWKNEAIERDFSQDYEKESPSLQHWLTMSKFMAQEREKSNVMEIGILIVD